MKSFVLSILAISAINLSVISQSDTLNQYDHNSKKIGWWVVCLDKDIGITEDSSETQYYK